MQKGPSRTRNIKPFLMMETAVTNAMFAAFIDDSRTEMIQVRATPDTSTAQQGFRLAFDNPDATIDSAS